MLLAGDASGGRLPLLLNRLAFGWVKQRLGGRVRYMTSGDCTPAVAYMCIQLLCVPVSLPSSA
jgi:hypothetical protein